MILMGIDPSYKATGWAVLDFGTTGNVRILNKGVYESTMVSDLSPKQDDGDRYCHYVLQAENLMAIAKRNKVYDFVVEGMFTNIVARTMMYSIEARAVICAYIARGNVHNLTTITQQTVKAYWFPKSKVKITKRMMVKKIVEFFSLTSGLSDHTADAIALTIAAYERMQHEAEHRKKQGRDSR